MSEARVFRLGEALQGLPLPATGGWPQGVWYDTLIDCPSAELLIFAPDGTDHQTPHGRNEAYVAARGTAVLEIDGVCHPMAAGDMAWVPAHVPHRFVEISADFAAWVMFVG